jgi:hypothetical protein
MALQILGAIVTLIAFVGVQLERLDPRSWSYLLLNVVGGGTLAVLAALDRNWGFLLLEGTWAAVAAAGVVAKLRGPRASAA